ncbi:MAG: DUF1553 domain-containing protein [Armatimonadetes bacterium]|nr:DUF1553 domain-containing protein [Armatimonadota bacterium]
MGRTRAIRGTAAGVVVLAAAPAWVAAGSAPGGARATARVEFNREIRPILTARCFACHGPDRNQRRARLRLDQAQDGAEVRGALQVISPGKPEASLLLRRILHPNPALRMPPGGKHKPLAAAEVELLRRWIREGAQYQSHWAYLTPRAAPPPAVRNSGWPHGELDRFVLARLEAAGLTPSPAADPATLVRRVSLDLTGMPPTPAEVEAFAAHPSDAAYEQLVDRLLASPRYAERMASFWFDLVRYANTVGYHGDQEHAIVPYRDYVIQAFRDNLPFDRFTVEQLAGDLLPTPTMNQRIATGYNRMLQTTHEGGAQDGEYRAKYMADRIRNLGSVWLGSTVGCAECHDHKFDPFSQKEFYQLAAFFADIEEKGTYGGPDATPTPRPPEIEVLSPFDQEEAARVAAEIARAGPAGASVSSALQQEWAAIQKRKQRTMVTVAASPRVMRVLRRGDWMDQGGEVVQPAVPQWLPTLRVGGTRASRLDLAQWLTTREHPLTARVFVNRIWQLLFGAGLCRSGEDFGSQGDAPTHPELLDTLAVRFVEGGWNVKQLVRTLVLSSTYRQSSAASPALQKRDPENRLLARQARFRLPAEMVRDQALLASGLLVERLGGPPARPYQPEGYYALLNFPKRTYVADRGEQQFRRAVYMHWQRQYLHPMLRAFDAPTREECTAQRPSTSTPLAALTLLNDPTFVEAARGLALRTLQECAGGDLERIRWAWRTVLGREPAEAETGSLARLLGRSRARYGANPQDAAALLRVGQMPGPEGMAGPELAAWTTVARALFNLSETITRN